MRVASLNRLLARDGITKSMRNQIKKSLKTINLLNETYSQEYTEAVHRVQGELALHKIRILNEMQLNEEQRNISPPFLREAQRIGESYLAFGDKRSFFARGQPYLPLGGEKREK